MPSTAAAPRGETLIVVTLPEKSSIRWALFGRHIHHDHLIRRLAAEGFPPPVAIVCPDEQYERDRRLLDKHGLFSRLENMDAEGLVEKHVFANVNDEACLSLLREKGCNVAFSISCRNIIKRQVIDFFEGRLFNLHDSHLPDERGGALNSWRILNGVGSVGNTIHLIDEGIDTGAILFQHREQLCQEFPKPLDYDKAQLTCAEVILDEFMDAVVAGKPLEATPQDNSKSIYFPRLYTELNGAIDFSWSVSDVERFIRAFSDPYPGAFAFVKERKIYIHEATVLAEDGFHAFCNGRVVTSLDDGTVNAVAGGGLLNIAEVTDDGKRGPAAEVLKIMNVLHVPRDILDNACLTVPAVSKME